MADLKPEEKSPLLLYLVDGDENVSQNNKRVNFDKGRLYGISSGATAVFTEFPSKYCSIYITSSWLLLDLGIKYVMRYGSICRVIC